MFMGFVTNIRYGNTLVTLSRNKQASKSFQLLFKYVSLKFNQKRTEQINFYSRYDMVLDDEKIIKNLAHISNGCPLLLQSLAMLCRWCGAKIELTELDDCQNIQFENFTQDCAIYTSPPVGIPFDFYQHRRCSQTTYDL